MGSDRLALGAAICSALFLAFVWGAVAVKLDVFPNRYIGRIEAGLVAWRKMEAKRYPQHMIRLAGESDRERIELATAQRNGELILMTGGFYYRPDLCPDFGCMAYVMTREGEVLKTWEYDPARLFTKDSLAGYSSFPGAENVNVQGASMTPDGDLVVTFQARNVFPYQIGIAKFSWYGELVWLRINRAHHWAKVGPDGRIYVPVARVSTAAPTVAATQEKNTCQFGAVFDEGVLVMSSGGEVLKEFWIDDLVRKSDRQGLVYAVRDDCDPHHVNYAVPINAAAAARMPGTREGDILVSLRSSSSLVVIDQDSGLIRKIVFGPMVAQHSPQVLPDGRIAVFDNLGGVDTAKGSRVLIIDPATGAAETLFPRTKDGPGADFFSEAAGHVEFCADGKHALIAETLGGRVFEVEVATGKVTWIYKSLSDVSLYLRAAGEDAEAPVMGVMHTRAAEFLTETDFARLRALRG
jgi:hypothetical protein